MDRIKHQRIRRHLRAALLTDYRQATVLKFIAKAPQARRSRTCTEIRTARNHHSARLSLRVEVHHIDRQPKKHSQ